MKKYSFAQFGLDALALEDVEAPTPGPHEILLDVKALSLNYRDLLVIRGHYNPRLELPATPISDGAGVVAAVGDGVTRVRVGDRVVSHFITGWLDGPFQSKYVGTTLGCPLSGLAAQQVVLPEQALLPLPDGYDFAQAATLPIAALTAWSALVTEGSLQAGQTVLTLGTGGVSIFALQFAKALGAQVIITSSNDEKLARAMKLGADHGINYQEQPRWEDEVLKITGGQGVDVTVETAGAGTLDQSMKSTRGGGVVALLGALTGIKSEVTTGLILMKRLRIHGVIVDSRAAFERMNRFLEQHALKPVIDATFAFDELTDALAHMEAGRHFGKIVVNLD